MYSWITSWIWDADPVTNVHTNTIKAPLRNFSGLYEEINTIRLNLKKTEKHVKPSFFESRNPVVRELHKNDRFCISRDSY